MTDTITLPRSVVEQALEAWEQARGALAYVAVGNAPSNPNLARSTCSQAVWVLDAAEPALRAALVQPQVEQEPFTVLVRKRSWLANQWEAAPCGFPDYGKQWADERINVYIHPQNLNCKSNQARLATLWGYEKPQPPRQPLTDEQIGEIEGWFSNEFGLEAKHSIDFARAIERAHGIGGE